jgi:hypothetical protein
MSRRERIIAFTALLGGTFCFTAASAQTSPVKPNPPPQICVNNQCSSTQNPSGNPPTAGGGTHQIKWNPGHYMASYGKILGSSTVSLAPLQPEMDDLNNQDAIVGYRIWITWGALERSQGVYDFSVLDAALARLKTAYNKPKHLIIGMWMYGQSGLGNNQDWRVLPLYIQQDPKYGASPVAGMYGWWGPSSNGKSTGQWAPAYYNPAVMDRYIALIQALGNHFDSDPYVEGLYIQEDSAVAEAGGNASPPDPKYSDQAWLTQLERLLTASTAAFPHTSVLCANTWFVHPDSTVALEEWMLNNRIAPSSADTWGQSAINQYGTSHLADGMQVLIGTDAAGGMGDIRPRTRAMMDVESDELASTRLAAYGGPWTPLDILNALNQTYWASHAFWTRFAPGTTYNGVPVPSAAIWSNMAATLSKNPLIHTDYPPNYP